jgi:phosphonate transport system substrate-binding protein
MDQLRIDFLKICRINLITHKEKIMTTKISKKIISLMMVISIMFLGACQSKTVPISKSPTTVPDTNLTQDQILSLGIVSTDPAGTIKAYQPLATYLAKQLSDAGIVKGQIVVVPDIQTMVTKLKSGEVDLYYESAYGALYTYENAGAVPLVRGWRNGVSEYHSIIMVRKDSGITSLDGLKGKLLALSEAKSTTGGFLPRAFLISSGYTLLDQSTISSIPADAIGYLYTGSPDNMVSAVLSGKAVAGTEEGAVYDGLTQDQKNQVAIIAQTQDIPRSLIMASATMSSSLRDRVVAVLKAANQSDDGKAALASAKKTTEFDDLPLGAQGTMDFLQTLFAPINK